VISEAGQEGAGGLRYRLRRARGEPDGALVMLHGRGSDELDLLPLIEELDPRGRLLGVTPRGPLYLPPGGAHWYVVPRVGYPDPATFHDSYARLAEFIDALPNSLGVPLERTVIGGFSQGAVMSYALGLGPGLPTPAGLVALSGFIPTVPGWDVELDGRAGLPVAIGHGTFDPVIPVDFAREARRRLEQAGLDVAYSEKPAAHGIHPELVLELRQWIPQTIERGATTQRHGDTDTASTLR
jgi:phospholipase/carboxylesterase